MRLVGSVFIFNGFGRPRILMIIIYYRLVLDLFWVIWMGMDWMSWWWSNFILISFVCLLVNLCWVLFCKWWGWWWMFNGFVS